MKTIADFLNENKEEVMNVVFPEYKDEDEFWEDEDGNEIPGENRTFNYIMSSATVKNKEYEVAVIGNMCIGMDFSFEKEAVEDEFGDSSEYEWEIAGRKVYGIAYNI